MFELIDHPDGRVTVATNADPALAHHPVGWRRQWLGLDLGRNDPSALVLLRDTCLPVTDGRRVGLGPRRRTVVWADRVKDADYTSLAAYVARLLVRPEFQNTRLAVDATGLGGPFSDVLLHGGVEHFAVTMTAGAAMTRSGNRVNVSKNLLLELLASGFERGDLTIAGDLPLRTQLVQEVASFELATTTAGNLVLAGGGKGHHADMAIALALAWLASERLAGHQVGQRRLVGGY